MDGEAAARAKPAWRAGLLRLALLWLVGVDLRLTVLAVPPVLPLIHRDLGLSEKAIGALSGLPLLLLGLAAIPGALLIARLGARRACIVGLCAVAVTSAMRGAGGSAAMLFAATFAMGAGVAVLQPTLPSLVGEWFADRAGLATAVYANGLLSGEGIPAALTIPAVLPLVGGSWGWSFVVWALPVAATAVLLALMTSERTVERPARRPGWLPDWRNPRTWQLGLLQGGTGGLYFGTNAFIPDYLHAINRPDLVGACLSALNLAQLPASLVLLLFARRLTCNKSAFVAMPFLVALGIAALLGSQPALMVAGAGIIGFAGSFVLILTLALPPLLAPAGEVHRLAAGMFTIGYAISCLTPPLGGAIWDATGIPATAFLASAVGTALMLVTALSLPPSARLRVVSGGARAGRAPQGQES